MSELESIADAIRAAFDGVRPPKGRTLMQAEAVDDYSAKLPPRKAGHLGRWQDLPRAEMDACAWAFPHLGADGVRYYLPAILVEALRCEVAGVEPPRLVESVDFFLQLPRNDDLRGYLRERLGGLDTAQRQAVARYVQAMHRHAPSVEAWGRVAREMTHGEDWFDLWMPPRGRASAEAVRAALDAFPASEEDPAALAAALREGPIPVAGLGALLGLALEGDPELVRLLDDVLQPDLRPDRVAAHRARLAGLDPAQRAAVRIWVDRCSGRSASRARWERLGQQEAGGPREDWLDLLTSVDLT